MADTLPEVILEPTLLNLIVVSYDGEFSEAGNYHGTGTATFASGAVYEGKSFLHRCTTHTTSFDSFVR